MFDVCLLGTGGMMPKPGRFLTSLMIRYAGKTILVDCGEGTQIPMQSSGLGFRGIDMILITHYHGDHIAGLPGILFQMKNSGRTEKLVIMGPRGIEILEHLIAITGDLGFEIELVTIKEKSFTHTIKLGSCHGELIIHAAPLNHTVPCLGYSFSVRRLPLFNREKAEKLGLPKPLWGKLHKGEAVEYNGMKYGPKDVTESAKKGLKVTYATDMRPTPDLVSLAYEADLFICEGMYGPDEYMEDAKEKKHMLFSEAAKVAKEARVKELMLTHYSPVLLDPDYYIKNATDVFKNTVAGKDLTFKTLIFEED